VTADEAATVALQALAAALDAPERIAQFEAILARVTRRHQRISACQHTGHARILAVRSLPWPSRRPRIESTLSSIGAST